MVLIMLLCCTDIKGLGLASRCSATADSESCEVAKGGYILITKPRQFLFPLTNSKPLSIFSSFCSMFQCSFWSSSTSSRS